MAEESVKEVIEPMTNLKYLSISGEVNKLNLKNCVQLETLEIYDSPNIEEAFFQQLSPCKRNFREISHFCSNKQYSFVIC